MSHLPSTMRALVLDKVGSRPSVKEVPTPQPDPGSAVVQILAVGVLPYANDVYVTDARGYPMPTPLTIGSSGVGRVSAVGPDSVKLSEGQLVLVDCYIRARDDRETSFLAGLVRFDSHLVTWANASRVARGLQLGLQKVGGG